MNQLFRCLPLALWFILLPGIGMGQSQRAEPSTGKVIREPAKAELAGRVGPEEVLVVGDRQTYNEETELLTLEGDPYILTATEFIEGNTIKYLKKTSRAEALGQVRIRSYENEVMIFGGQAVYNTKTRDIMVSGPILDDKSKVKLGDIPGEKKARLYAAKDDLIILANEFQKQTEEKIIRAKGGVTIKRNIDGAILSADEAVFWTEENKVVLAGSGANRPAIHYIDNKYQADTMTVFTRKNEAILEGNCSIRLGEVREVKATKIVVVRGAETTATLTGDEKLRATVIEYSNPKSILKGEKTREASADEIVYVSSASREQVTLKKNARFEMYRKEQVNMTAAELRDPANKGKVKYRVDTIKGFADEIAYSTSGSNTAQLMTMTGNCLISYPNVVGVGDIIKINPSSGFNAELIAKEGIAAAYMGYSLEDLSKMSSQKMLDRLHRKVYGSYIHYFHENPDTPRERRRLEVRSNDKNQARIVEANRDVSGTKIDYYGPVGLNDVRARTPEEDERAVVDGKAVFVQFKEDGTKKPEYRGESDKLEYYGGNTNMAVLTSESGDAVFRRIGENQVATARRMYVTGLNSPNNDSANGDKQEGIEALLVGNPKIVEGADDRVISGSILRIGQAKSGYSASIIGQALITEKSGNQYSANMIDFKETGENDDQVVFLHGLVNLTLKEDDNAKPRSIQSDQAVVRRLRTQAVGDNVPVEAILNGAVKINDTEQGVKGYGLRMRYYDGIPDSTGFTPSRIFVEGSVRVEQEVEESTDEGKLIRIIESDFMEYEKQKGATKDEPINFFAFNMEDSDARVYLREEKEGKENEIERQGWSQRVEFITSEKKLSSSNTESQTEIRLVGRAEAFIKEAQEGVEDNNTRGERITFKEIKLDGPGVAGSTDCRNRNGTSVCTLDKVTTIRIEGEILFEKPYFPNIVPPAKPPTPPPSPEGVPPTPSEPPKGQPPVEGSPPIAPPMPPSSDTPPPPPTPGVPEGDKKPKVEVDSGSPKLKVETVADVYGTPRKCQEAKRLGFFSNRSEDRKVNGEVTATAMTILVSTLENAEKPADELLKAWKAVLESKPQPTPSWKTRIASAGFIFNEAGELTKTPTWPSLKFPFLKRSKEPAKDIPKGQVAKFAAISPNDEKPDQNLYYWLANQMNIDIHEFALIEQATSGSLLKVEYDPWRSRDFCAEEILVTIREDGKGKENTVMVAKGSGFLYDLGLYPDTFQEIESTLIAFEEDKPMPDANGIREKSTIRAVLNGASRLETVDYRINGETIYYINTPTVEEAELFSDVVLYDKVEKLELKSPYAYINRTREYALARRYPRDANSPILTMQNEGATAEAEIMEFYMDINKGIAKGDVLFTQKDTKVASNRAVYDRNKDQIELRGDVVMVSQGNGARPEWALYDVQTRKIRTGGGKGAITTDDVALSKGGGFAPKVGNVVGSASGIGNQALGKAKEGVTSGGSGTGGATGGSGGGMGQPNPNLGAGPPVSPK